MLSGSVAMSIYIIPGATRDFDFIIHLESKDIDRFGELFFANYLNPWIGFHVKIAGDHKVTVNVKEFDPALFTPQISLKIGWHYQELILKK